MSLRIEIIDFLKRNRRMTIKELEDICHLQGRKVDNGTRRFREMTQPDHSSFNPNISTVRNEKRAIIGYKWTGKDGRYCFYCNFKMKHPKPCIREERKNNDTPNRDLFSR